MPGLESELNVVLDVIREAGARILDLYASFSKIENAPADISTEADKASQEIILQRLHQEFADDRLCGEEQTSALSLSKAGGRRAWIVDPIDGTRGFAVKNGEFSIMIGLVEREEVILGAVFEPAMDRMTYAVKGEGCFWQSDGGPANVAKVSTTSKLADAVLSISRSQKAAGEKRLLEAFGAPRAIQTYSAGIKLAQVARGETDMYLGDYLTLKEWDVCAGHILVLEAGGKVTSVHGEPIKYQGTGDSLKGNGILATNGALHPAALGVLETGLYQF